MSASSYAYPTTSSSTVGTSARYTSFKVSPPPDTPDADPHDAAAGGVWVDPPEYFTQIVYPAYLKAYGGMFKDGDVEHGALRKDWENQVQVLRPLEGADEMSRAFELSCEAIVRSVREGAGRPIGGRE
jgi:hypothetical protein